MAQFTRQTFFAGAAEGALEVGYQSTGPIDEIGSVVDSTTELEFAFGLGTYIIQIEAHGNVLHQIDTNSRSGIILKIIANGDLQVVHLDCALHEIGVYCARESLQNRLTRQEGALQETRQKIEKLKNLS